jgi:hypothetical protein
MTFRIVFLFALICLLLGLLSSRSRPTTAQSEWKPAAVYSQYGSYLLEVQELPLPTQGLVAHPTESKLYVAVSAGSHPYGNSVVAIHLPEMEVELIAALDSHPGQLAISRDGQSLYVGEDGAFAVKRVNLLANTIDLYFSLGDQRQADSIVVLGENGTSVAVARRDVSQSPRHEGVAIYDEGVMRPLTTASHTGSNVLQRGATDDILYGYNNETSSHDFYVLAVSEEGVVVEQSVVGLLDGARHNIHYLDGLIYSDSGQVIDAVNLVAAGSYAAEGRVRPDTEKNLIYILSQNFGAPTSLHLFDLASFAPIATLTAPKPSRFRTDLIQIGEWLAYAGEGTLFLMRLIALPEQTFLPAVHHRYCPDFSDDFSSPYSGWPLVNSDFVEAGYLGGEYRVATKQGGYIFYFPAPSCPRQNYTVAVDARWSGTLGNSYGLIVAITPDFTHFYMMDVNTEFQLFRLALRTPAGFTTLVEPTSIGAIKPGNEVNRLEVRRDSNWLALRINGHAVTTVYNNAIGGETRVGLLVSSAPNRPQVEAYFDNFERFGLPDVPNPTYPFPLLPGRPSEVPGMMPPDALWAAWDTKPEE